MSTQGDDEYTDRLQIDAQSHIKEAPEVRRGEAVAEEGIALVNRFSSVPMDEGDTISASSSAGEAHSTPKKPKVTTLMVKPTSTRTASARN